MKRICIAIAALLGFAVVADACPPFQSQAIVYQQTAVVYQQPVALIQTAFVPTYTVYAAPVAVQANVYAQANVRVQAQANVYAAPAMVQARAAVRANACAKCGARRGILRPRSVSRAVTRTRG